MVEVLAREKIGMMKKVISQIIPGASSKYGVMERDLIPLLGPE
jgi:hypothetical protein